MVENEKNKENDSHIHPICMSAKIKSEPLFNDIERMAFNAHLIWENSLNIDLNESYKKFKEPYNYEASLANAISIKYKLLVKCASLP